MTVHIIAPPLMFTVCIKHFMCTAQAGLIEKSGEVKKPVLVGVLKLFLFPCGSVKMAD